MILILTHMFTLAYEMSCFHLCTKHIVKIIFDDHVFVIFFESHYSKNFFLVAVMSLYFNPSSVLYMR